MRDKKASLGPSGRRRRKLKVADPTNFGAKPTRRAGQLVGERYRLEGLLGHGATSNVYLAVDQESGGHVVVKQLTSNSTKNEQIRARFLAEARTLSQIHHPGIVRVHDFAAPEAEQPFLVMEALVGETLASLLTRRPLLPIEQALAIARQTALGLAAAHESGIVHRDIKPDNLFLLGPLGSPFGVKLIDFGMAKLPQPNGTSGEHTVLGTVEYMAPEQVMADPVDARTDVYGFGIVLYRLLTGHLPFDAPEGLDVLTHHLFADVPSAPVLPVELEEIVSRATRKHPDNRYPNMAALVGALDVALGVATGSIERSPLAVEPDVYAPQNETGREVAALLAERYRTMPPPRYSYDSTVPDDPEDFDDLADDDLERCEG